MQTVAPRTVHGAANGIVNRYMSDLECMWECEERGEALPPYVALIRREIKGY